MSCPQKKACISEESFIDIRLGFVVVVQTKKYPYPTNLQPFIQDFKGFPLEAAALAQAQRPEVCKSQESDSRRLHNRESMHIPGIQYPGNPGTGRNQFRLRGCERLSEFIKKINLHLLARFAAAGDHMGFVPSACPREAPCGAGSRRIPRFRRDEGIAPATNAKSRLPQVPLQTWAGPGVNDVRQALFTG